MNYKHLYYFWAAARAGGIVRASERLHITPQTLSAQIKLLEDSMGCQLFQKTGRSVELTAGGRTALSFADQIFQLGAELEAAVGHREGEAQVLNFRVGIVQTVPKVLAYRLLEPALELDEPVRLMCHEGEFRDLLGQLAVQRLDLVIANEAAGRQPGLKAFNHPLGSTGTTFFCAPALRKTIGLNFPRCLNAAPLLLQGMSASQRQRLEMWLAEQGVRPRVVGEFDDAALLKTFGSEGRGVFLSATALQQEICKRFGVHVLGHAPDLLEEYFAISARRRISHPCVAAITRTARSRVLRAH